MPRYRILGRNQTHGSDDLLIPVAFEAVATGSWLLTYGYVYTVHHQYVANCLHMNNLSMYFAGGLVLSGVNLTLLFILIRNTLRGTIINIWPRRTVGKWMAIKAVVSVFGFVGLSVISKRVLYDDVVCDYDSLATVRRAVEMLWIPCGLSLYTCSSVYKTIFTLFQDSRGHRADNLQEPAHIPIDRRRSSLISQDSLLNLVRDTWNHRLSQLARLLGLGSDQAFMKLGTVFATVFYDDPEIVTSDVIAGIIALSDKQHEKLQRIKSDEQELLKVLQNPEKSSCRPTEWMTIPNAAHYVKYAMANYGWSHYIYSSYTAFCHFIKLYCTYRPRRPQSTPDCIHGDNSFAGTTQAICAITGLSMEDLVHVSFSNQLYELPFYVAIDREKKSIIVSLRGTVSVQDVIIDLISFGESMSLAQVPDAKAHEGMYTSAMVLYKKLTQGPNALLRKARTRLIEEYGHEEAMEYKVIVTGHSLGAGVAAILAILLYQDREYKNLECYCYSPPGGLLSVEAARYSETFIFSVIIEDDFVARLGLSNIYKWKLATLEEIQKLDVPKYKVLARPLERALMRLCRPRDEVSSSATHSTWENNPEASEMVRRFQRGVEKAKRLTKQELDRHTQLYPPGCILYVHGVTSNNNMSCSFVRGDSAVFQEIYLCTTMMKHHMPTLVRKTMYVMEDRQLNPLSV